MKKAVTFGEIMPSLVPQGFLRFLPDRVQTEDNRNSRVEAGVPYVGMGSQLFPKEEVANGDPEAITKKYADTLAFIKKLRG